jgi:hypothetical protein
MAIDLAAGQLDIRSCGIAGKRYARRERVAAGP